MSKILFLTPVGTAKWPHLVKADTTGKYADGKWKTGLIMTPEEAKPLVALIDKLASTHKHKSPQLPYKKEVTKEGKETGNIQFTLKSKFAPAIFDVKNHKVDVKRLDGDFSIGAGSRLKIAGEVFEYEKGLSLQMQQVQVIELQSGSVSMFGEEEGTFDGSEFETEEPQEDSSFSELKGDSLNI